MKSMGLEAVKIVDLPKIVDARGNLSFIEEFRHIPFPIKRSYWVYDVPGCRIFLFTLDDFSYRTRGTADADERQAVLLERGM